MSPRQRFEVPDPIARYNKLAAGQKRWYARQKMTLHVDELQRFMILRALLSHLRSLMGGVSQKSSGSASIGKQ